MCIAIVMYLLSEAILVYSLLVNNIIQINFLFGTYIPGMDIIIPIFMENVKFSGAMILATLFNKIKRK